jgi:hypothetical protein
MQHWIDRSGIAHLGRCRRRASVPRAQYLPPMATPDRLATMAMMMLQTLYDATGGRLEWRNIDLVVSQPEHFEALEYAVGQQWIEVSAVFDAVRLTAEGRRVLIR